MRLAKLGAIRQNTVSASAIWVTRKLSWAELARPAASIALSGMSVFRVRVARMSTSAFSLPLSQRRGVLEDGKSHGRIEMRGVAPIRNRASRRTLENYRMDVQYAATVQDGVLDEPT